ncbi:DUF418 domain-containing protein [Petrimonas sp.]|uniref:DUF418 domain-containing protein n=1 Tax=Petrimonas sp. TaxID=2023866 RepID=UPI003F51745F
MEQNKPIATPSKRIDVIDALRGFALFGVIITHMLQRFGIFAGVRPGEPNFPALDGAVQWLFQNVIMGRFINIFAFLFGMSFFIQMDRAAKKGIDFRGRFLWRLVLLFVIGRIGASFTHVDILSVYALFGVILVFLYPLKNKVLMIIALLLLLGIPRIFVVGVDRISNEPATEVVQPAPQQQPQQQNRQWEPPTFFESVVRNQTTGTMGTINYQFGVSGRGYVTMALFILGLIVGRVRFFEEVHIKRKRNVVLFFVFLFSTLLVNFIIGLLSKEPINLFMLMRQGGNIPPIALVTATLNDINLVLLSGALAMGFITLFQVKSVRKYLESITPYGRMGLTNYEMQGVIGAILFSAWGFGSIFGTWRPTELFILGVVIYILQAIFSKYWMKYFLYGPLEWLWRSGTYLKWQPFRRKSEKSIKH